MKNYETFTLKQLDTEKKVLVRKLALERRHSTAQMRLPQFDPILKAIETVGKILEKRTGPPCRCELPKRIQRKMGLLPKLSSID